MASVSRPLAVSQAFVPPQAVPSHKVSGERDPKFGLMGHGPMFAGEVGSQTANPHPQDSPAAAAMLAVQVERERISRMLEAIQAKYPTVASKAPHGSEEASSMPNSEKEADAAAEFI